MPNVFFGMERRGVGDEIHSGFGITLFFGGFALPSRMSSAVFMAIWMPVGAPVETPQSNG